MSLEMILEKDEAKLVESLRKQGVTPTEIQQMLRSKSSAVDHSKYSPRAVPGRRKNYTIGWFSDLHCGHLNSREDAFSDMADYFDDWGIHFAVNAGDTLEGMSGREGHVYELKHIGYSAQMDALEEQFKQLGKKKIYSIEPQQSHSGWYGSKANAGVNIGEEIERRVPNYVFIGYDEQDLVLDKGVKIRLRHPGGGTAYAISYKMQKYIESISGGNKPSVIVQGHFHKFNHMFYRNIQGIDAGCLQDQTIFLKKKGSPAHVCFGKMDLKVSKTGIEEFSLTQVPYYD